MKALLVVDIQNMASQRDDLFHQSIFMEKVNSAIEYFEMQGLPVIYIQHNNKNMISGTSNWLIDDRVRRVEGAPVVQKFHGDAFIDTNLKEILIDKEVDEVMVCGLISNGCVKFTCLGALREGFTVHLLKDGHSTLGKDAEYKIVRSESELQKAGVSIVEM